MPKGKANKNLENVSYAIRMAIEPLPWWEGILCNKIYAPSFFLLFYFAMYESYSWYICIIFIITHEFHNMLWNRGKYSAWMLLLFPSFFYSINV